MRGRLHSGPVRPQPTHRATGEPSFLYGRGHTRSPGAPGDAAYRSTRADGLRPAALHPSRHSQPNHAQDDRAGRGGGADADPLDLRLVSHDVQARGVWVTGDQVAPPRRARTVRVREGKTFVTDGPFAETKEAIGGFDILECGSLEEAVQIAAGHPIAQFGTIEVRPFWGS